MSATTELLVEQIKATKEALAEAKATNQPTAQLQQNLDTLTKRLQQSQQALNESVILKD